MACRLRLFFWLAAALSVAGAAWPACADPPALETAPAATPTPSVEKLVERVRRSLVVISFKGRDGEREGLGTGFVIDRDGLIATNLHVIGEARPIVVRTLDGRRHEVTTVEASERAADLALLRVAAHDLTPLEFVLFVNDPQLLGETYARYLEAQIREANPFTGLPLMLNFRPRAEKKL